jgi:uncharacterized membrane protein
MNAQRAIVKHEKKRGQTLVEFMGVVGVTILAVVMLALLLYTFKQFGGRILNLVASEYP